MALFAVHLLAEDLPGFPVLFDDHAGCGPLDVNLPCRFGNSHFFDFDQIDEDFSSLHHGKQYLDADPGVLSAISAEAHLLYF